MSPSTCPRATRATGIASSIRPSRAKTLIPLDGLRGLFPSTQAEFYLAYGEAVAAVDFFIRTYGEQTLLEPGQSYADGVSDDDGVQRATGGDVAAFNRAWFESLGNEPQDPVGPQPGEAGPPPSDWTAGAGSTPTLGAQPGARRAPPPGTATPRLGRPDQSRRRRPAIAARARRAT